MGDRCVGFAAMAGRPLPVNAAGVIDHMACTPEIIGALET